MPLSIIVRTKAVHCLPLLLAVIFFAGCSIQERHTQHVDIQGEATESSRYYLEQAQQSSDDNKADWQLLAIRSLLNEGKPREAKAQFDILPARLNLTQQTERDLLNAQLLLALNSMERATQQLNNIDVQTLSDNQKVRYYQMVIVIRKDRPSLSLLRPLIALEPLLKGKDHQDNIDVTWLALTQITPDQLNNLVINADENTLQGWLDLLDIYNANRNDPGMLNAGVSDWQIRYPQNPAARSLPSALSQLQKHEPASTERIALLLPLSGQAQVFGNAIQQGFNDAKNGLLSITPSRPLAQVTSDSVSSPANPDIVVSPSAVSTDELQQTPAIQPAVVQPPVSPPAIVSHVDVRVYDTYSQPLDLLLTQAQQDGATLIVGPLLKNQVESLVSIPDMSLNVLALNEPAQLQARPNICYFALSPEDEAYDAAQHIWQQEKRTPLLLLPQSGLGDRIASAFAAEWNRLGGGIVLQQRFGSVSDLKQRINSNAGISLNGTPVAVPQQPAISIANMSIPAPQNNSGSSQPSGRNIDSTYIVATQQELELIKPMIAMRTSSRNNIALYASSRSAQTGAGPDFRLEMEGLQFSDIPLLSGSNPTLMQQTAGKFSNDYSLMRLYAMGTDAWQLANHFNEIRQRPDFQLPGNTGHLTVDRNCVINRKLSWNQYRQGQIIPVN
ncbi:penicillin-binding protein activator [Enterobacteriaceae bacterium LUAb1]